MNHPLEIKPIEMMWHSYAKLAEIHEDNFDIAHEAFLIGACGIFLTIILGLSNGDDISSNDMHMMETLQKECNEIDAKAAKKYGYKRRTQ